MRSVDGLESPTLGPQSIGRLRKRPLLVCAYAAAVHELRRCSKSSVDLGSCATVCRAKATGDLSVADAERLLYQPDRVANGGISHSRP
jgi:hypothetical protein